MRHTHQRAHSRLSQLPRHAPGSVWLTNGSVGPPNTAIQTAVVNGSEFSYSESNLVSGAGVVTGVELEERVEHLPTVGVGDLQGAHDLGGSAGDVAVIGLCGEFELAVLRGALVVLPLHVADPSQGRHRRPS